MQFGHALEQVLWKVVTANPAQGPLYLLKINLSDSFYCVCLCVQDAPLLGVAFPVAPSELLLTAIPLVLPMGWTESTFTPSRGPQCHSSVGWSSHHHNPAPRRTSQLTAKNRGDAASSHPDTMMGARSPLC